MATDHQISFGDAPDLSAFPVGPRTKPAPRGPATLEFRAMVSEIDRVRAETNYFFESLIRDVNRDHAVLTEQLGIMEAALTRAQKVGGPHELANNNKPLSSGSRSEASPTDATAATGAALSRFASTYTPHATGGLSFHALLKEVEAEHDVAVADEEERRRYVAATTAATIGTASAANLSATTTSDRTPLTPTALSSAASSRFASLANSPAYQDNRSTPGRPTKKATPAAGSGFATPNPVGVRSTAAPTGPSSSAAMPLLKADVTYDENDRPVPTSRPSDSYPKPLDLMQPTAVLVEFKRQRVLQYDSDFYVAPGEHVVVGGDRGEDIGLVTYSWAANSAGPLPATPARGAKEGIGKVLRIATPFEVGQLQGVQAELEKRAKEVAQLKVQEHGLPMKLVDAEYQFDRKKLTFFYQSQHRLDFRVLVRDLYKTFRARIWMELV
jgi:hypothetical protein